MDYHFEELKMTKFTEKLQDPKFMNKTESLIGGHIMSVYRDAGMEPPVPFIRIAVKPRGLARGYKAAIR